MDENKIKRHIILDTGGILRLGSHEFSDDVLLTVPSVLKEIKDKAAAEKLLHLRDRIEVVEPDEVECNFVKRFSKETGDFGFLSETDFSVIALTLMYHKRFDEKSKLNAKPRQISLISREQDEVSNLESSKREFDTEGDDQEEEVDGNETYGCVKDGEGSFGCWVTKDNMDKVLGSLSTGVKDDKIRVACITTDYSMQNVILQMGLNLIEIHGFSIKSVKRWGLVCCGCYTYERDTSKKFCGKCGNATLDRVPIKINSDGTIEMACFRKKINLRGTIYSIPKPKKGAKNQDIILAEDQLMMGGRQRKLNHERKKWEKACRERDPFSNDGVDFESSWCKETRSFRYPEIKIGLGKGNPNSNRWQKRNSKK
ncbi:hypothetical protein FG379_003353 [Cryptosporidium bovis]|uniref:uncharacterized protein n=1 Tax=Cryptosporidium bovis TaxID=310047 RepID=UPI00351A47D2|nr:hypothetical protein FG379_003353 [Cryptosporidium bovis]